MDLVDLVDLENCCKMDAKIRFDTAENEPSKVRGFLIGVRGVIKNDRNSFDETTSAQRGIMRTLPSADHFGHSWLSRVTSKGPFPAA